MMEREGRKGSDGEGGREGSDVGWKEGGGHHSWALIIHQWGLSSAGCACHLFGWGHCIHGHSSFIHGGLLLSVGGRGALLSLSVIICGCWVMFVGAGFCLWVVGLVLCITHHS